MRGLPVGEPSSSHWRPLVKRPTRWLKGGEWVAYAIATTTTTTTGYPATVELVLRPRPKQEWHDGGVRARLSITPRCPPTTNNLRRHPRQGHITAATTTAATLESTSAADTATARRRVTFQFQQRLLLLLRRRRQPQATA
jgi:hypothetical protein